MTKLFGANGAQDDQNLLDYFIARSDIYRKNIFVGGFGSGKSSIMIARAKRLHGDLYPEHKFNDPSVRPWYMVEEDLDRMQIIDVFENLSTQRNKRREVFGKIWETEILRRILLQLNTLYQNNRTILRDPAWKKIKIKKVLDTIPNGSWKAIQNLIHIVGQDVKWVSFAKDALSFINEICDDEHYSNVNLCINELKSKGISTPFVAIEPIETPESDIEDDSISLTDDLIAALLNCWFSRFRSERVDNFIDVYISVPWHRYSPEKATFDHRIEESVEQLSWTKPMLRELISERLDWEIERIKRSVANDEQKKTPFFGRPPEDDHWNIYFDNAVNNSTVKNIHNRYEDSFSYLLRHTCWRPREIISICRQCVELYCERNRGLPIDVFFRSRRKIFSDTVRDAVSKHIAGTSRWRLTEFRRKYGSHLDLALIFDGVSTPASRADVEKLIDDNWPEDWSGNPRTLVPALWDADIVGICVEFTDDSEQGKFVHRYGADKTITVNQLVRNGSRVLGAGFLFRYSAKPETTVNSVLNEFQGSKLIFHPIFNERFAVGLQGDYPLGA